MNCLVTLIFLASAPVVAGADAREEVPAPRLRWNPAIDLPVTATLAAGLLLSETVFKKALAPANCRWCGHNAVDDAFTGLRVPLASQGTMDLLSYLTVGVLPLAALGYDFWQATDLKNFGIDALLVMEAMFAAATFNQVVKFAVGRERPFVARLAQEGKGTTHSPEDNNLSFFSGHTSMAFSLAVAVGTVAELRRYRHRVWVWTVGLSLATATAVLRMAADKHYFTDVLTGALVGGALGYFIPAWLHGVEEQPATTARLLPMPGGLALVGHF
jgi:membrane-associated phospholipid phosphatase